MFPDLAFYKTNRSTLLLCVLDNNNNNNNDNLHFWSTKILKIF